MSHTGVCSRTPLPAHLARDPTTYHTQAFSHISHRRRLTPRGILVCLAMKTCLYNPTMADSANRLLERRLAETMVGGALWGAPSAKLASCASTL